MSHHQDIFDNPSLTKKVFANMKRVGTATSKPHKKHKSKKQQPIAPKVPSLEPSPEHQLPSPSNDPIPTAKDSLKLQELMDLCIRLSKKVMDLESEVIDIKSYFIDKFEKHKDRGRMIADMDEDVEDIDEEDPVEVEEVLEVVTSSKLITKIVTTTEPTTTISQVPKVSTPKRRRGVVIQDPEEIVASIIMHTKVQSKDKGK
nr:hypothetical protein [Tanacetum cinerariifolium]